MHFPDGLSRRHAARGLVIAGAAFAASLGCSVLAGIDQDYREVDPSVAGSGNGGASGSGGSSGVGGGSGGSSGASGSGGATGGTSGAGGTGGSGGATGGTGGGASTCAAAGKQCLPAVAPGWVGPVVRNASSGAPPACPGSYATEVPTGLRGGLVPGAASCACSCDPPNNQVCTGQLAYTIGPCLAAPFHLADLVSGAPCTPVTVPPAAGSVKASAKFSADNCAAVTAATIPTPTWGEQVRSCGAALGGEACPGGDVCVPVVPAAWTSCIYKVGAGHICPAGYADQSVYYDAFQDTRVCSGCSCGPPTGTCGGTVHVATGAPCNSETQIALGACAPAAGVTHARYTAAGPNSGACVPGSASLNGSANPQNPVTFCCRP